MGNLSEILKKYKEFAEVFNMNQSSAVMNLKELIEQQKKFTEAFNTNRSNLVMNLGDLKELFEEQKKNIKNLNIKNLSEIEEFRIAFLGSKGAVKDLFLLSDLKNIPIEQKPQVAKELQDFKQYNEETYQTLVQLDTSTPKVKGVDVDYTLPGDANYVGSRHPLSIVRNQIISIFNKLGFAVAEGPEIEDDWHNFTALNLPENHPARDMQDTFYISQNPDWLLRTHTSSVQARVMEQQKPPIRIICPGRVYRNETISARAHCFFHQVEGLYIDENVSFADLKQTLYFFVQEMFGGLTPTLSKGGGGVKVRFRPSYFPFTEPSAEMDISCTICNGSGCNICKHTGWVEILGCGMVHPNMLNNFNIDPEKYTGFAFGLGIERICQLKYQINDLRLYSQNDVRFLKQFTSAI